MTFNGVEITPATIQRTREHFVDLYQTCITEALSGQTRVNNLENYVAWREDCIKDTKAGKYDDSFTFMQRAHWLQTGESVALLP